jgi:hypothetical protein
MSQDLEMILRKSLDSIDRIQKIFLLCFFAESLAVMAGLLWLGHLESIADVRLMLIWSVVIILVGQVCTTGALALFTMAFFGKILKAIELLSRD